MQNSGVIIDDLEEEHILGVVDAGGFSPDLPADCKYSWFGMLLSVAENDSFLFYEDEAIDPISELRW